MSEATTTARPKKPFYKNLTVQVLFAITVGIILGHFAPDIAVKFQPLGDGFVKLVKMVIGPVVFLTVVTGIASIGDMRKVGRVGGKALIYFELVTTVALVVGVIVVNLIKPGAGLNAHSAKNAQIDRFIDAAKHQSISDFLLNVIPDSVVGAFVKGDLLPILFFAVIFGAALVAMGDRGKPIVESLDRFAQAFFKVIGIVMYVAPLGAFGAMSFTIGRYGIASLASLGALMASVYITMFLFVFVVLGIIARVYNFNIFKFVAFIRNELLIVLGTSSSESVLPRMITKMEEFGCSKTVTGLVLPTGYSFNLDGTSIYLSMAAIFIAQAFNIELTIWQELEILLVLLLTSKGAAAVTGGGFVTLAATLTATNVLPVEGLALLLGVDRFMSEARALTNLVGNGVATVVIAKVEKEFDEKQAVDAYRTFFDDPKISKI